MTDYSKIVINDKKRQYPITEALLERYIRFTFMIEYWKEAINGPKGFNATTMLTGIYPDGTRRTDQWR